MKKGGIGGANTNKNGLLFERDTEFEQALKKLKGYEIKKIDNITEGYEIFYLGKKVAESFKKHSLYKGFLEKLGINWKDCLSSQLLPDNAIYVIINKTLFIVEIKYQGIGGSTDEKLQTCHFKKKQYERLTNEIPEIKLEFCYILNDRFKNKKYEDTLNYIQSIGCKYFFNTLPLDYLGLPK